jgi:hypothetical protein
MKELRPFVAALRQWRDDFGKKLHLIWPRKALRCFDQTFRPGIPISQGVLFVAGVVVSVSYFVPPQNGESDKANRAYRQQDQL